MVMVLIINFLFGWLLVIAVYTDIGTIYFALYFAQVY